MKRAIVFAALLSLSLPLRAAPDAVAEARRTLAYYKEEMSVVGLLEDVSAAKRPADYAFRKVAVVDIDAGTTLPDRCVRVAGGRIVAISADDACEATAANERQIDGRGRFLAPGLADMHVHQLMSADVPLLNIANGVTTVRDLDGYAWMLRWRQRSRDNDWIAPDMIVTGTIIASHPMGIYAVVVNTPEEARAEVRRQAAAGYDYIKVHNILAIELYDAVIDEARRKGIGVVGHIPHAISVAHAIAQGQETIEHLKGYINDRNLEISPDDWITPTRYGTVWNDPTLITHREYLRGAEAEAFFASEAAQYVPHMIRERWRERSGESLHAVFRDELAKRVEIMHKLEAVTRRFLAGTDAGGGMDYMVPGFDLHAELDMLRDAGLSTLEALRAATANAAQATGREQEFGRVALGLHANLALLDRNPLDDLANLERPAGVMIRGRWLHRKALDDMLARLAKIYRDDPPLLASKAPPDQAWVDRLVHDIGALQGRGYVFPSHHLDEIGSALKTFGFAKAAERIASSETGVH